LIKFIPHNEIALNDACYDSNIHKAQYRYDYVELQNKIDAGELDKRSTYRYLILNDLFFIVLFVMEIEKANHPFVVRMCNMVQNGPSSNTLDIWARAHYKDLYIGTPVLTSKGWKYHGELEIGDQVFSPSGKLVNVIATKQFTDSDCRLVEMEHGVEFVCGAGHLWKIETQSRKRVPGTKNKRVPHKTTIMETGEIASSEFMYRPMVRCSSAIEYPEAILPIDPYVLGVWLGDGETNGGRICGIDEDIFNEVEKRGCTLSHNHCKKREPFRTSTIYGFSHKLKLLNVLGNKHIPDVYLTASSRQRLELLQGLIDTDGSVSKRNRCVTFSQKNIFLSQQVKYLANSLGFKARITPNKSTSSWHVTFQVTRSEKPCLLERKLELLPEKISYYNRGWRINKITKAPTVPTNCIQVDSDDGMYLVGNDLVPTHNSTIITIAETIQYQLKHPDHCTGIFAYSRPAAKKFLRGIKVLLESSDLLKWCFPDVLYAKPESESPKWSEDDGLVLRRAGSSRGESSVEAWGLTEGMPTGRHFERCVFDDLETEDIRESPDMLNKVYSKFEMAGNLGTFSDSDVTRVIGTYYSHFGPNIKIRDKKYPDGSNIYKLRLIPGSDNGTRSGNPVLMDLGSWKKEKTGQHFNSQQLCDPTPSSDIRLSADYLKPIEPQFIPRNIHKFMVLDQAGGDETDKQSKD